MKIRIRIKIHLIRDSNAQKSTLQKNCTKIFLPRLELSTGGRNKRNKVQVFESQYSTLMTRLSPLKNIGISSRPNKLS